MKMRIFRLSPKKREEGFLGGREKFWEKKGGQV